MITLNENFILTTPSSVIPTKVDEILAPCVWFMPDCHFNHDKDFIWLKRGFNSVKEMNETIVERYNEVVGEEDIVYFLGDVGMGTDYSTIANLVSRMKGIKILIIGNHDSDEKIKYLAPLFGYRVQYAERLKYKGVSYYISHYPTLVANCGDRKPVWNICGHEHSIDLFADHRPHSIQLSLEYNNCYPMNLETIHQTIKDNI